MQVFEIDIHDERVQFIEAKPAGWAGYLPVAEVREALDDAGIPPQLWPAVPTDNRCLERAMGDLRGQRHLVRPLKSGRGWSLVVENADALDLEKLDEEDERHAHTVEITAKVERAEDDHHVSTLRITPEDHPAVPMIREAFRYHRGTDDENPGMFKCSQDLSVWFSQTIIPWVRGVATRSRGGSYYVLKGEMLRRLERVAKALEGVSEFAIQNINVGGVNVQRTKTVQGGRIILKPELGTTAAVEVLLDSVINSFDKELDGLDDELRNKSLGLRALGTRGETVEKMTEQLKFFEQELGIALTDIKSRIDESEAAVGMLKLKQEAEKDKAA